MFVYTVPGRLLNPLKLKSFHLHQNLFFCTTTYLYEKHQPNLPPTMDSSSIVETITACKKENWRPSPSDSDTPIPTSFQLLIDLLKDQSLFLGKLSPQSPSFDGTIAGAGATIVTLLMKLPESVLVSTVVCEQAYHFVHAWIRCTVDVLSSRTSMLGKDDDDDDDVGDDTTTFAPLPSSLCSALALCFDPATPLNKISGHDNQNVEDEETMEWRRKLTFGDWVDAIYLNDNGTKEWLEAQVVMEIPEENGDELLLELQFKKNYASKNVTRSRYDTMVAPHHHDKSGEGGPMKIKKIPDGFYKSLEAGMKVDGIDKNNMWFNGTILHTDDLKTKGTVRITYRIYTPVGLYTDDNHPQKLKFFGYRIECDEDHKPVPTEIQPLGFKADNILKKLAAKDDYKPVADSDDPVGNFENDAYERVDKTARKGEVGQVLANRESLESGKSGDGGSGGGSGSSDSSSSELLEYAVYRGVECEGGRWYVNIINYFGRLGGFDVLYRVLDPSGKMFQYTLVRSLKDASSLVHVVCRNARLLTRSFCVAYSRNFSKAVQSAVLRMPVENVKITKSSDIGDMVRSCYPLLRRTMDKEQTLEIIEMFSLRFANLCYSNDKYMMTRLEGFKHLLTVVDAVNVVSNVSVKKTSHVDAQMLLDWMGSVDIVGRM